jgi:diaminopimelate decarboxylase
MFSPDSLAQFKKLETPFYFYNIELLRRTLNRLKQAKPEGYHVHYALKANANPNILELIKEAGLGADCVSGNEIKRALASGFPASRIVFAGVGKSDKEIQTGLDADIFCFNVESIPELEVLNELAGKSSKVARIALRVNPNVDAYTHKYITTGLEENKFGINPYEFEKVAALLKELPNISFQGIHFHIGSQINDLAAFKNLCLRVNDINRWFIQRGLKPSHINLGGGLGINYREPDRDAIVDFDSYFSVFTTFLEHLPDQEIHFELGRSIVGQCGSLISRVLYVKNGINTNFAILDAGMTELIRPALYQAYHKIENLSSDTGSETLRYDVVGPICESSDCFGKGVELPETKRGDLIAIRSAGAYGEVMSNGYNLREQLPALIGK